MSLRNAVERLALADACRFELRIANELRHIRTVSDNPATRSFLDELIAEEETHLASLSSFMPEDEIPESVVSSPAKGRDITAMLREVLKKEDGSVTFYELLAERTPIPAIKSAFQKIAEAEKGHVKRLARHIQELCGQGSSNA